MARCCLLLAEHQRIHGSPCNHAKISPDRQRDLQLLSSFFILFFGGRVEWGWSEGVCVGGGGGYHGGGGGGGWGGWGGGGGGYTRDINVSHVWKKLHVCFSQLELSEVQCGLSVADTPSEPHLVRITQAYENMHTCSHIHYTLKCIAYSSCAGLKHAPCTGAYRSQPSKSLRRILV